METSMKILDEQWVSSWKQKLQSTSDNLESETGTIFRVLESIRATDPIAYEPKFICIGPYHRYNPQLESSNRLKLLYFKRILNRNPRLHLEHYLKHVETLAVKSRSCYSGEINMSEREFKDMLLIDGCFIIELLLLAKQKDRATDPILGCMPTRTLVEYDMLLIENQLPFCVLESLFELVGVSDEENSISLVNLAVEFFRSGQYLLQDCEESLADTTNYYHILHVYHSCITSEHLSPAPKKEIGHLMGHQGSFISKLITQKTDALSDAEVMAVIPSTSNLLNSGIQVRKKKDILWSVSCRNGMIMDISPVQLHNNSSSFFRNMIAFEQHSSSEVIKSKVTAYAMLMSCLIESEDDLSLLQQRKIVGYILESKEEAINFFKKICTDAVVNYNKVYLANLNDITMEVRKCYDNRFNQWRKQLKTLYFSNPETTINLIYGVLLVTVLTLVQTILISFFPCISSLVKAQQKISSVCISCIRVF